MYLYFIKVIKGNLETVSSENSLTDTLVATIIFIEWISQSTQLSFSQ